MPKEESVPLRPVERLKLVGGNNQPAGNLHYTVELSHGNLQGRTDKNGFTRLLTTQGFSELIRSISVDSPYEAHDVVCCRNLGSDIPIINLKDKRLCTADGRQRFNCADSAVAVVELPKGKERSMTTGEIAMARTVYGDAVHYSRVKIHHGGWWAFMGMQRSNTAVTPNGEMYYPSSIYRNDFSNSGELRDQAIFMHEMAHIWQYQMGYPVKRKGLTVTIHGPSAYRYTLMPDSRLHDFNFEQQAEILSDYYMVFVINQKDQASTYIWNADLLRNVVEPFIGDQGNKIHLPR
ncbi:hypothetical protein [Dyella flava]|uniref:Effector protein n=1 Tax=Dyella flava TaxID=1920170 RepID=A0ABS2K5F1_9GAMM|nr:hypothetical protein [Dyella flava]MBM7125528.1 hypothetical protein [Dyella flava]